MIHRRREFPNSVKRAARLRSEGICECHRIRNVPGLVPGGCNQKLGPDNLFYEHIICDGIGGEPTLENCAVLVKTCWSIKTHTYDQPVVAKAERQWDKDNGIRTGQSFNAPPIPGSRNTIFRKRMSGRTELRL